MEQAVNAGASPTVCADLQRVDLAYPQYVAAAIAVTAGPLIAPLPGSGALPSEISPVGAAGCLRYDQYRPGDGWTVSVGVVHKDDRPNWRGRSCPSAYRRASIKARRQIR